MIENRGFIEHYVHGDRHKQKSRAQSGVEASNKAYAQRLVEGAQGKKLGHVGIPVEAGDGLTGQLGVAEQGQAPHNSLDRPVCALGRPLFGVAAAQIEVQKVRGKREMPNATYGK